MIFTWCDQNSEASCPNVVRNHILFFFLQVAWHFASLLSLLPSEVHSNFLDAVADKHIGEALDSLTRNQHSIYTEYAKLLSQKTAWQPREAGRWLEIQLIEAAVVGMIRTVKIDEDVWFAFSVTEYCDEFN